MILYLRNITNIKIIYYYGELVKFTLVIRKYILDSNGRREVAEKKSGFSNLHGDNTKGEKQILRSVKQ
jgi:hypothetical protein